MRRGDLPQAPAPLGDDAEQIRRRQRTLDNRQSVVVVPVAHGHGPFLGADQRNIGNVLAGRVRPIRPVSASRVGVGGR